MPLAAEVEPKLNIGAAAGAVLDWIGAATGAGALVPKLNNGALAGAAAADESVAEEALPKKSGIPDKVDSFGLSLSVGLPKPKPAPAVFFGPSILPNKVDAAGAPS